MTEGSDGNECYSIDGEVYYNDLCTVLDMANDNEQTTIYEGVSVPCCHSHFINCNYLVEQMKDFASCEHGDFAENYLDEMTDKDVAEFKA